MKNILKNKSTLDSYIGLLMIKFPQSFSEDHQLVMIGYLELLILYGQKNEKADRQRSICILETLM